MKIRRKWVVFAGRFIVLKNATKKEAKDFTTKLLCLGIPAGYMKLNQVVVEEPSLQLVKKTKVKW